MQKFSNASSWCSVIRYVTANRPYIKILFFKHNNFIVVVIQQEKFATLSLAFKTDRQTLDKRLELHLRARDVAENNIQKELQAVKESLKVCSLGPTKM